MLSERKELMTQKNQLIVDKPNIYGEDGKHGIIEDKITDLKEEIKLYEQVFVDSSDLKTIIRS